LIGLVQLLESVLTPLVIVFTISNLASMGLQSDLTRIVRAAGNLRFMGLVIPWGWLVGSVLGYLVTVVIPLDPVYATVVLLGSLASCAPFLPPMIAEAHGDIDFAGAFTPVAAIGTVLFMPLLAPVLVKGVTLGAAALAKPLVFSVLIPLLVGAAVRTYATQAADRVFGPVKVLTGMTTLLTILGCSVLCGRRMLDTAGSSALAPMTIFMVVLGLLPFGVGFGLERSQRTVTSLGMGTRNTAALFAGVLAIPDGDPRMMAMVVMWSVWSFILALAIAPITGQRAGTAGAQGAA